jgi:hypothetical protein
MNKNHITYLLIIIKWKLKALFNYPSYENKNRSLQWIPFEKIKRGYLFLIASF